MSSSESARLWDDKTNTEENPSSRTSISRQLASEVPRAAQKTKKKKKEKRGKKDGRNAYLPSSCSWREGPRVRPGWAQPRPDRRRPDGKAATTGPVTGWRWPAAAASSPAATPVPRVYGGAGCAAADRYSAASAAWRSAAPPPTWTDRRHPTAPDDTLLNRARCSPPGGSRRPPAVVRTASTAPV